MAEKTKSENPALEPEAEGKILARKARNCCDFKQGECYGKAHHLCKAEDGDDSQGI